MANGQNKSDGFPLRVRCVWVNQGKLEPGASCENIVDEIREERIRDILKSYSSPPRKRQI